MQDLLLDGYSVELGGIGYFTLSLKVNKQATDPKELRSPSVSLKDIRLRMNCRFKNEVESRLDLPFYRSPLRVEHPLGREKCRHLLEKFLEEHPCINRQDYAALVGKTKRQALLDINDFLEKGVLKKYGAGRSVVYIKARYACYRLFYAGICLRLNIFCLSLF